MQDMLENNVLSWRSPFLRLMGWEPMLWANFLWFSFEGGESEEEEKKPYAQKIFPPTHPPTNEANHRLQQIITK